MQQTKELAVKNKAEIAAAQNEWGLDEQIDASVIEIPKLLLMQGLSKAVAAEKASMGEFIDSLTYEVVGSAREKDFKPVEIIPLTMSVSWVKYEKIGDKLDFKGVFPLTKENADWKWEETNADGDVFRNDQCLNFYVLLKGKADDPMELPYALTFRRTSFRNGKKLSSHFAKCQRAMQLGRIIPPASKSFMLSGYKETNDHGTYYVMDIEPGETIAEELQTVAKGWVKTIRSSSIKVDDSDLHDGGATKEDVDVDESEY